MFRRSLSSTLLIAIAMQLVCVVAFASVCFEPCPDDVDSSGCPPVCSMCAGCTHAQTAILDAGMTTAPVPHVREMHRGHFQFIPQRLPSDILHVPLFG